MSNEPQTKPQETLSSPVMVPLGKLIKDPDNVRTTGTNNGIEALADNIHAEGLLQNLVVRKVKGGKYAVTGGERRRTALNLLVKRKQMKATDQVPCRVVDGAHISASLSENIHRLAMHPADQFIAWAKMADDGLTVPEIAKRHGATTRIVEQRLKLGRLSPTLLEALKTDEIDVETASAFSASDDHEKQVTIFETLKSQWNGLNPRSVKAAITGDELSSSDKLAQFVGREAYEKAGGEIRADLFDEEIYFKDAELLTKLAADKMETEAEHLKSEGWAWVEISFDQDYRAGEKMREVRPHEIPLSAKDQKTKERLEKRLAEIEDDATNGDEKAEVECDKIDEQLSALAAKALAYKTKDQAMSGCFLNLNRQGGYIHKLGFIRPEDDPKVTAAKKKAAEEKANMPTQLTKALRSDLSAIRLEVFKTAFLKNPTIARDLLAFHTIRDTISSEYTQCPFNLSAEKAKSVARISKNGDMGRFTGRTEAEKLTSQLSLSCFEIDDATESFEAFHALSEGEKIALQAYAAALMLEPQLNDDPSLEPTLERVATLMSVNVAQQWTPDADFFTRTSKTYMSEVSQTVINQAFSERHAKNKKSEFAKAIGTAFDADSKPAHISKDAAKRLANWIPDCMV